MNKQSSVPLIANTLPSRGKQFRPVNRQLGQAAFVQKSCGVGQNDPYSIKDRTIDQVVDCLLKELSW